MPHRILFMWPTLVTPRSCKERTALRPRRAATRVRTRVRVKATTGDAAGDGARNQQPAAARHVPAPDGSRQGHTEQNTDERGDPRAPPSRAAQRAKLRQPRVRPPRVLPRGGRWASGATGGARKRPTGEGTPSAGSPSPGWLSSQRTLQLD